MNTIAIAIDGPAGAGKSTISRKVAETLGYIYVDTGALYRAIGLGLVAAGIDTDNTEAVEELLKTTKVNIVYIDNEQRVMLNGKDVSEKIRTPQVSMMASKCSALPVVRTFLLELQRKLAREHNVVMDGRDIATVVLPDAKIKIFLTADANARAARRYDELILKDPNIKFEDVLSDLQQRDYNDSHRAIAPLKPAEDSIMVDTTDNTLQQSIELITNIVKQKL
ncbi:MAG: (d)CMP kinase [Oscillospiraceae bacterium]|nr:(d)CMP kinase [Oscillospiraceae bacterium]